jgi:hypothetical protein
MARFGKENVFFSIAAARISRSPRAGAERRAWH